MPSTLQNVLRRRLELGTFRRGAPRVNVRAWVFRLKAAIMTINGAIGCYPRDGLRYDPERTGTHVEIPTARSAASRQLIQLRRRRQW
jgi:hypothetical protein